MEQERRENSILITGERIFSLCSRARVSIKVKGAVSKWGGLVLTKRCPQTDTQAKVVSAQQLALSSRYSETLAVAIGLATQH